MLTILIVWCGCYTWAHTKMNNKWISFSLTTLINARSSSICELFWWLPSALWESYMNGIVIWPNQPNQALWSVSHENMPHPTQSHVERGSPMGCSVQEGSLMMIMFNRYSVVSPKDIKVTLLKNSCHIYKFSSQQNFFLWDKDKCLYLIKWPHINNNIYICIVFYGV